MKYRMALVGKEFPELTDNERGLFCCKLANLHHIAVTILGGEIIDPDDGMSIYGITHLHTWKWNACILMDIGKNRFNPEPEFIAFVDDMCVRLNITPYREEDPKSKEAFEKALKGRCSFTLTTKGQYAWQARLAYTAWCMAKNPGKLL